MAKLLLLDTHVLIWLAEGRRLGGEPRAAIDAAARAGLLAASATSAWEVGLLATQTRVTGQLFGGDARRWFAELVRNLKLRVVPLGEEIALEAAYLPGEFHRDPSDRWIVATARMTDATLVTADRRILAYGKAGHVVVMPA
jgi:PIN domain nuclease of toxin-antitoxin system